MALKLYLEHIPTTNLEADQPPFFSKNTCSFQNEHLNYFIPCANPQALKSEFDWYSLTHPGSPARLDLILLMQCLDGCLCLENHGKTMIQIFSDSSGEFLSDLNLAKTYISTGNKCDIFVVSFIWVPKTIK